MPLTFRETNLNKNIFLALLSFFEVFPILGFHLDVYVCSFKV